MIRVFDDVRHDVQAYRTKALQQPFGDVTVGATFHGIAPAPDTSTLDALTALVGDCGPVTTFLRLSPKGQLEPNFIHTDCDMGAWTAIYYLTEKPAKGDGTTFWQDRQTDAITSESASMTEAQTWTEPDRFQPWCQIGARLNRLILFPAGLYHSRSLFDNYGETPEAARLIQVIFGGEHVRRH